MLNNMQAVWIAFEKRFQSLMLLCRVSIKVDHECLVNKQCKVKMYFFKKLPVC